VFTPTAAEVADARRVVEAARRAERRRQGSVALNGRMIDAPVVAQALRIIAISERR
jgi:citrate lyase subunit beta/citryl-CoA lyase